MRRKLIVGSVVVFCLLGFGTGVTPRPAEAGWKWWLDANGDCVSCCDDGRYDCWCGENPSCVKGAFQ